DWAHSHSCYRPYCPGVSPARRTDEGSVRLSPPTREQLRQTKHSRHSRGVTTNHLRATRPDAQLKTEGQAAGGEIHPGNDHEPLQPPGEAAAAPRVRRACPGSSLE